MRASCLFASYPHEGCFGAVAAHILDVSSSYAGYEGPGGKMWPGKGRKRVISGLRIACEVRHVASDSHAE